jgi:acetyltransferase-like isoleucine patch superfamily enzyme
MNIITRIFRRINNDRKRAGSAIWLGLTKNVGFLRMFYETKDTEAYVLFKLWFFQKVLGFNKKAYWPTHFRSTVNMPKNIYVGVGSAPGLSPGCYIQGIGKIYIGDYVGVGPNVGLLSGTHQVFDLRKYKSGVLKIGDYSWIGMNSVVMPNVELGPYTIVQAGSTVTESFKTGYCVIGGNPAKLIKQFPQESYHLFEKYKNEYEYHGFIPKRKFEEYRKRNLWV